MSAAATMPVVEVVSRELEAVTPVRTGIAMGYSPAEAKRRLDELQAFVRQSMVEGVDYGTVAGSEKKSLLQPGAQKLAELYGLTHRFLVTDAVKDWENGFFYFEMKCELRNRDERFVGEGVGSCNSRENRYGVRWVYERDLPPGTDTSKLKSKQQPRWCFASEVPGTFDKAKLTRQTRTSRKTTQPYDVYLVPGIVDVLYAVPNEDVYTLVNTIHKMACKRSLVHSVVGVTRSSGIFTQDREDLPPDIYGVVAEERPWERAERVPEVTIVDRDVKPENIVQSAAAAAASPAPAATAAAASSAPKPSVAKAAPPPPAAAPAALTDAQIDAQDMAAMAPLEKRAVDKFLPQIRAATSDQERRNLVQKMTGEAGSMKTGQAFGRWFRRFVASELQPKAGPAKAQPQPARPAAQGAVPR